MERIYEKLKNLNIKFEDFSHNPTFTCEEAKDIEIPWERVKSLVLNNKNKDKFFMVVLWDNKKLDVKKLQILTNEKKLSFASEENIIKKIWIKIWHISPFSLINNKEKDLKIFFDKSLKWKKTWFHPLRNNKTVVLNMDDLEKFLINLWFWENFEYVEL